MTDRYAISVFNELLRYWLPIVLVQKNVNECEGDIEAPERIVSVHTKGAKPAPRQAINFIDEMDLSSLIYFDMQKINSALNEAKAILNDTAEINMQISNEASF